MNTIPNICPNCKLIIGGCRCEIYEEAFGHLKAQHAAATENMRLRKKIRQLEEALSKFTNSKDIQ